MELRSLFLALFFLRGTLIPVESKLETAKNRVIVLIFALSCGIIFNGMLFSNLRRDVLLCLSRLFRMDYIPLP